MADAFRGLKIRLGADARPLNSAINSVKSAAQATQKQLNAMEKALKFDPTNVAALSQRVDLVGDKATLAARAIRDIKTTMNNASAETRNLAAKTEGVYAAVQRARSEYRGVNTQLQKMHDSVRRIIMEEIQLANPALDAKKAFDLADDKLKSMARSYGGTTAKAKELTAEMKKYLGLANARGLGKVFGTTGQIDKLITKYEVLKGQSKALAGTLSQLKYAEGFKAAETQLIAWQSELRQASAEAARFKSELYSMQAGDPFGDQARRINLIEEGLDQATASARKMDALFKKLPGDIEAAKAKLLAEKAVHESIEDKLKAKKAILASIESAAANEARSNRNVYKWVAQVETKLAETDTVTRTLSAHLEDIADDMRRVASNTGKGSKEVKELASTYKQVKSAINKCRETTERLNAELKTANAARKYRQTAEDVRLLEAELRQATSKASALRSALDFSKTIRTMGYGLYSTITPAIMMAGRYAIQSARDIDSAYRDMRKTVNGTEDEFQHLLDSALKFSTTHFTTAEQMLEIESIGGQLGIAATDLEAFGETVANLDIATNIDAETVAEQLGKMGSVLNVTEDQYDNFGDALVRLGNNMPVMESDIMTLSTRFMGMGKVVGMDADEILGWAAAASATGQKAEAAGSAMQRFISKMETAVVGGGETLEQWASVAGMSAQEFADAFNKDASTAMKAFVDGLGRVQKEGGSVNQVLQDLKINNVRDKQLLEGLAMQAYNAGDGMSLLGYALKLSSDAWNGFATETKDGSIEYAGDAAREAGKKAEGFSGQVQEMINTAQLLSTELAQGALPYVIALKEAFQGLATAFSAMPDSMKTFIVGMTGALALVGPLAVGFGAVGAAVDSLMEAFTAATAARTLAKAASGIGPLEKGLAQIATVSPRAASGLETVVLMAMEAAPTFVAMIPPIAAAAAAIAFLVTDISKAAKNADNFNKSVSGYSDAIKDSLPGLESSAGGFDGLASSAKHAQVNLDSLAKSQAEAREAIVERNRQAQDEIAELSAAKSVIDKYLNKSLDPSEAAQFRAAVERVNEVCGTNYEVVNAAAGAIRDEKGALLETCGAIDEYINKKRIEIQQQALSADYADAHAAEREAYKAMISQLATYNDLLEKANNTDDPVAKADYEAQAEEAGAYYEKLFAMHNEAQKGEEAIAKQMAATAEAAEGEAKSIETIVRANDKWMDSFKAIYGDDAWATSFDGFISALNEVGVKQDQLAEMAPEDIAKVVDAYSRTEDIKAALDSVGISVTGLEEKVRSGFEAAGRDFDYYVEQLGGNTEAIAQAFNKAGGASAVFANVTEEQIAEALTSAEGNVDSFIAKLQEFSQQNAAEAEVNVTANTDEAEADIAGVTDDVNSIPDGEINVEDGDVLASDEDVNNLGTDIEEMPDSKDINVNVYGNAENVLSNIKWYLDNIHDKEVTVTTNRVGGDAAGGFYRLHANGGFITNGPINLGRDRYGITHIAGEAGREWIKRHADGTTSIVPIENRRYLKPYAREIAGMIGSTGSTNNYYITLDYKAGDDAITLARGVKRELETFMNMEA